MVTLEGSIEREQDGQILFRVAAGRADAPAIGFPVDSTFWIKRAQCHVHEARQRGQHDRIRLSFELASLKAQSLVMGGC